MFGRRQAKACSSHVIMGFANLSCVFGRHHAKACLSNVIMGFSNLSFGDEMLQRKWSNEEQLSK